MSALSALTAVPSRVRRARPPRLRLVPRPAPTVAGNGVFIGVTAALVVAGMAALLLLNTSLAQGAFELQSLQQHQSELQITEQALAQQVDQAESPVALKKRADELGMVPVAVPAFLRLADGKVLGTPTAAKRAVAPPARAAKQRTSDGAVAGPVTTTAVTGAEGAESQARPNGPAAGPATGGQEGAEAQAPPTGTDAGTPDRAATPDPPAPAARESDGAQPDGAAATGPTP